MRLFKFTSHKHIGDNIICTGAVRNVRNAYPDFEFAVPDAYREVWENSPDVREVHDGDWHTEIGRISYGSVNDEQHAIWGNVVEGFTHSLCFMLGIPMVPIVTRTPVLHLTDEEKEWGMQFENAIVLNANCQTCSISKGNPRWQEVVDGLDGYRIIQMGGNCPKDISPNLAGVEDWRGRTTARQLMAMAYGCRLVISPPSAISNIAATFSKPQVIVNASREPDKLLDYPNAVHVSHRCSCGWGVETGCITLRTWGSRACPHPVRMDGIDWCQWQMETEPEDVIRALRRLNAL